MSTKNVYHAIGLMSGSSLDGLDICYVEFNIHPSQSTTDVAEQRNDSIYTYRILASECILYDDAFRTKLKNIATGSALELAKLHTDLGKYFGTLSRSFIEKNKIKQLDFIASHGQTIFHQPLQGFTTQLGCGAQIAAHANCPVVCDLRSTDLAYNGQGAPLVPAAEKYLFPGFNIFLNIGGIANISFHKNDSEVLAYDICAANTLLNYLAQQKGSEYDKDGLLAKSGNIIPELLSEFNAIEFCKRNAPKSLGTEHVFSDWISLVKKYDHSVEDKLATTVEHIAMEINKAMDEQITTADSKLFITGGGALNSFLIERIQHHTKAQIVIPDILSIQFKEALAMAFIGLLRILEKENCLASVTGASKNSIGGAVYLP